MSGMFRFHPLTAAVLICGAPQSAHGAEEQLIDTREGEDLTLKCRFSVQETSNFSFYWARSAGANFENVAIGDIKLNTNYK